MSNIINSLLMFILILNLLTLGSSRIHSVIRLVALQGAVLGLMPFLIHGSRMTWSIFTLMIGVIGLKGFAIPFMMRRALREVNITREVEPLIGLMPSVALGTLGSVVALLYSRLLPLAPQHEGSLLVPASLATLLTGFILLTTRYKALMQVVGYLVLENGIFIFGMLLIEAMPTVVEMGVLLDLFVGIFVISIIANKINRSFSSMDTRVLVSLKD